MATTITGIVKDAFGEPLEGLRVLARDVDGEAPAGAVREALTDASGAYRISYAEDAADPVPHVVSLRRPVVTLEAPLGAGGWRRVARSRAGNDREVDAPLTVDFELPPLQARETGFDPRIHGFHFVNRFVLEPSLFGLSLGPWHMGFCGGMCAGALRLFLRGQDAPADPAAPPDGAPLFEELLRRQRRSLSAGTLARILEWQISPDRSRRLAPHSVGWRTKREWSRLKERLDAARPTVIVLIRSEGADENPTHNHQVLAIGYEWHPTTRDLAIRAYDPNHPDTTVTLEMNFALPGNRIAARQSTGERLRGFFLNPDGDAAAG